MRETRAYISTVPVRSGVKATVTVARQEGGAYVHRPVGRFFGRTFEFAYKSAERYTLREYGAVSDDPFAPQEEDHGPTQEQFEAAREAAAAYRRAQDAGEASEERSEHGD